MLRVKVRVGLQTATKVTALGMGGMEKSIPKRNSAAKTSLLEEISGLGHL